MKKLKTTNKHAGLFQIINNNFHPYQDWESDKKKETWHKCVTTIKIDFGHYYHWNCMVFIFIEYMYFVTHIPTAQKPFLFPTNYKLSLLESDTVFLLLLRSWLLTQDICQSRLRPDNGRNMKKKKISEHNTWREEKHTHLYTKRWNAEKGKEKWMIEYRLQPPHIELKSHLRFDEIKSGCLNQTDNYVYDLNFSGTSHHYHQAMQFKRCSVANLITNRFTFMLFFSLRFSH